MRSIRVPQHRLTPLKEQWETIVKPITGELGRV
jgi:rRNA processing protein Krr1/Pno1